MKKKETKKRPNPARYKTWKRLGEMISDGLPTLVKWNFLFVLTSLPLLTLGPSLGALHFCTNTLVKNDLPEEKAAKLYFSAFRACFRRAFPLGIFVLFINLVFGGGLLFYLSMTAENPIYIPLTSLSALVLFFFWSVMTHLLPMLFSIEETDWDTKQVFRSERSFRDLWRDAVCMTLGNMKGTLTAMLFSILFFGGELLLFPTTLPLIFAIGFSFPAAAGALSHTEPDI